MEPFLFCKKRKYCLIINYCCVFMSKSFENYSFSNTIHKRWSEWFFGKPRRPVKHEWRVLRIRRVDSLFEIKPSGNNTDVFHQKLMKRTGCRSNYIFSMLSTVKELTQQQTVNTLVIFRIFTDFFYEVLVVLEEVIIKWLKVFCSYHWKEDCYYRRT